ncbi:MAG: hypothetical protein K0R52_1543 [Alphaproteobacteria bacterium]|jgi:copper(I)-binding protein|nr:hypothetical protein [Alphaproteobacteria bacterium]
MILKKIVPLFLCAMGIISGIADACPPVKIGTLSIEHPWVRPSTGPNTAAYLTITNMSQDPDKLIRAECPDATAVELHNHIEEDGVMKMRPVPFIEIGKDPVELKPGGLHIMLMGLKDSFQGKGSVPLTLHFEKAGKVDVNFSVKIPENKPAAE